MPPPSLSPTAPKQGVLRARINADVEQAFATLAKQRGMKTSDLLRSVVLAELGRIGPAETQIEPDPQNAAMEVLKVRMPAFLWDAVKARSSLRGMPPGRWAAALLQSNLSRWPVFSDEETASLKENNRQLLKIGTNLNQMARSLNESFHQTEQVRIELMLELSSSLTRTRNVIRSLVKNTRRGWEADEP